MTEHDVATRDEWRAARIDLLKREKEWTRLSDELARQRQELPWVEVEKEYEFATEAGTKTLAELFDGRSQLLVYHFMFGPAYEAGCPTCSSMADTFDGAVVHLEARDAKLMCISRAPIDELLAYRERMGWGFDWASSADSDFNFDFGVSFTEEQIREGVEYNFAEQNMGPLLDSEPPPAFKALVESTGTDVLGYVSEGPGFSTFVHEDGKVFHAYSTYARGGEFLMGYYPILDRAPFGRNEEGGGFWLRRHDEYDE